MFLRRPNLGLPRRVVGFYLLFCLVAVAWLMAGVLITSHTVLSSRGINACLSRLGKVSAAVELEYVRSGPTQLQSLVTRAKSDLHADYCAIESTFGTYLAH